MGTIDDSRIELFLERAAVLRSSRAVGIIEKTSMTTTFSSAEADAVVELKAPDDEATLAYFARIREFDTPSKPIYIPDFFPVLAIEATPRRLKVVDWLRQAHADLGRESYDRPRQILGAGATPRHVWELWAYSHLMHVDKAKRAIWSSLGTWQQGAAKFMAYSYAVDLFRVVTVFEAMLRDRTLDDRGVLMQAVTNDRDPRVAGGIVPRFRAAKIRLL
jgi:hypothetical protein